MLSTSAFLWSQVESMALRGTVILALAGIGTQVLHRSSAAARHLLWRLALVAVLATPVLSALLPAWELTLPAASTRELVPDLYLNHPPGAPATLTEPQPRTLIARVRSLPAAVRHFGHDPQAGRQLSAGALCAVFLGGFFFCLARLGLGWSLVRRRLGQAREVTDPRWTQLVQSLAAELGLHRPVRLLQTAGRHTPLCTGVRHPAVVLPAAAASWSASRRRVILLHELAHIRRRDCLMQLVAQLACAVHWFNPLCWLAARRMRAERELACDDLVLSVGTRPSEYAGHLIAMAGSGDLPGLLQVGVAMVGRGPLERRITALLDPQRSHRPLTRASAVVAGLVAAALLIPVASLRAQTALRPLPPTVVQSCTPVTAVATAEAPALLPAVQRFLAKNPLGTKESESTPVVELTIDPKLQQVVEDRARCPGKQVAGQRCHRGDHIADER